MGFYWMPSPPSPINERDEMKLSQKRRCYSTTNPDKRSCRCLERFNKKYECAIGFNQIDGIPQEPCLKPLTSKDEIKAKKDFYDKCSKAHQ